MVDKTINIDILKKGIWLYFFLLIFEGALRKWVLPGLATPLLVVRDPVSLWLIYKCWKQNLLPFKVPVVLMTLLAALGIVTALVFGHGRLFIALYGARILVVHFPLMFVIKEIFDLQDVEKIGRIALWIAIPMVILIALQFYSPQSAWVNRGVGGDMEGAGFSGAMGYFRPPGTFSFTVGNVLFFNFVACFLIYFWISGAKINKLVLILATFALLGAIPFSISRTLIFSIGIAVVFAIVASANKPKFLIRIVFALIMIILIGFLLSNLEVFKTSMEATTARYDMANKTEGGASSALYHRFFGAMFKALSETNNLPFWGLGLGMGTNVGAKLLTGETMFLIAEWEWLRIIGEMGFVLGVFVILIRVVFSVELVFKSYKCMRIGNLLPWLLLSMGFMYLIQGQWAQPTILGFSTLLGGLILSASKSTKPNNKINV
ncbi:hypothetical protein LG651_13220 [Tamlana sp. 62-3]|uniref:Uncharacterized protein n=1 Tax=Neotamlana sargassicola TaxID=2883125 RepID=A0A9X1I847_9FLAO|nr:hypothetical protein [Tamlana sargassicola]MCB4809213.1 hypothetical protein [Tamlana sargassicola]